MSPPNSQSDTLDDGLNWNIVTVTYNSAADLREHWSGVELPERCRWTVVDNASIDDSAQVAAQYGAAVIRLPRNVGFGAANNIGARSVTSHFVAFANPDVTISVPSLARLEALLAVHPDRIVAPQLVNPDGSLQSSGRHLPTLGSKVANRLFPRLASSYRIFALPGEIRAVSWVMGAGLAMRTDHFLRLLWDERFFVYYEDADIGLRTWKSGGQVLVDGSSRWIHSWARETALLRLPAWRLELASMRKFYVRYPHLLLPRCLAERHHPESPLLGQDEARQAAASSSSSVAHYD